MTDKIQTEEIPIFTSHGWWRSKGRGWVAVVQCDKERPRDNSGLENTMISIDGEVFKCLSIECHKPPYPIQSGEKIGLLVSEKPKSPEEA